MSTATSHQPRPPLALVIPPHRRVQGRPWQPHEDDALRAGYRRGQAVALAIQLDRTVAAVRQRALEIGLARHRIHQPWTAADDARLREVHGVLPVVQIADRLGRSKGSVKERIARLGLARDSSAVTRYQRDQDTIARLREENQRLLARLATRAPVAPGGAEREQTGAGSFSYATAMPHPPRAMSVHPPPDAAHAPSDDARRLAVLVGLRLGAISPAEAAVTLGVPVERLGVEVGRAAKRGLDVVRAALLEDA